MPMKKKFLTVLLCCALLLSGCSSQNTTTAEDSSSQTPDPAGWPGSFAISLPHGTWKPATMLKAQLPGSQLEGDSCLL